MSSRRKKERCKLQLLKPDVFFSKDERNRIHGIYSIVYLINSRLFYFLNVNTYNKLETIPFTTIKAFGEKF